MQANQLHKFSRQQSESLAINLTCQCPACTDTPSYTYTPEYQFECVARAYGRMSMSDRNKFEERVRRVRKDGERYLSRIVDMVAQLKSQGRYETDFYRRKAIDARQAKCRSK